jgi:hypothetical protein
MPPADKRATLSQRGGVVTMQDQREPVHPPVRRLLDQAKPIAADDDV